MILLRNLITLIILTLFTINSKAQINHIAYRVPDSIFNNHPFAQLDSSSLMTSGVFWDRINPNFDLEAFQGAIDDNAAHSELCRQTYIDIKSAFIIDSLPSYFDYMEIYDGQAIAKDALPVSLYTIKYQKLKNYALDSGLISIIDSQFVINPLAQENPFETQYFWQISSKADIVPNNKPFDVVLPEILAISNLSGGEMISSMSIDFDDGLGYRNLFQDSIIQVLYSGEGNTEKRITLKFNNAAGNLNYAHLKWKTASSSSSCYPSVDNAPWSDDYLNYDYSIGNLPPNGQTQQVENLIESSLAYLGRVAYGKAYIKYRQGAATSPPQFNKPLIFIEGIDFAGPYLKKNPNGVYVYNPLKSSVKLGNVGWPTLWGCDPDYPFQKTPAYLDSLRNEGYDIIMLDFFNGADYMQRNAYLLIELINRINQNKISDEQIVIIGASMGGQVARWALNYMEQNNMDHCVRLFCSFDSPWKGAHIPLSLQSFLKYFGDEAQNAAAMDKLSDLRRPAAKQLLLYHIDQCDAQFASKSKFGKKKWNVSYNFPNTQTNGADPLFDQFYQEVFDMGDFPKKCRNVAMINGNNQGIKEFNNGQNFLNYDQSCWGIKNKVKLYAQGAGNNIISELNTGGLFKEVWEKRYKTFNIPNLDNSPGGYRGDYLKVKESLIKGLAKSGCNHTPQLVHNEATFVPAASAMALTNNDWDYKLKGQVLEYSSFLAGITHFESFKAPVSNQIHVEATDENMVWLLSQARLGERKLEIENNGLLTKAWNNPLENKHISGIDINFGGSLYLNANKPIYDEAPMANDKNFPPQGSEAKVLLGNSCSSNNKININHGGKIILGDNNYQGPDGNNKAEIHITNGGIVNLNPGGEIQIHKNSILIIDKGGKLVIKDGAYLKLLDAAEIIIEDGGELEYHQNAKIHLLNNDAIFHLKGKLSVKANATFTFSGNGKLIFDQPIPWISDHRGTYLDMDSYMSISPKAKFKVIGTLPGNKAKPLIECRKPFYLKDGSGGIFEEIDILNGAVNLKNGSLFFCFGKTFISNSTISSDDGNKHGGLRIWNNGSFNLIRNTDIKNGIIGVFAQGFTGGNSLHFDHCNFINNKTGLQVSGGSFNCSNTTFFNNILDIKGDALSGESQIRNGNFDNSSLTVANKSMVVTGQQGSLLSIDNSVFKNHSTFIRSVGLDIRSDCSEYNGSDVAINLEDGILYLNEDAGNVFKQNTSQSLLLTGNTASSGLFLKNGQNIFEKDNNLYNRYFRHIDAYYPGGFPQGEFMPNNIDFDADYNFFDLYKPYNHAENFFFCHSYAGSLLNIHNFIFNNNISLADCNSPTTLLDIHPLGPVIEQYPTGGGFIFIPGTSDYLSLKQAALEGVEELSLVDEERNDLLALQRFIAILNASVLQANASTEGILQVAYKGMFNALNNAYQNKQLLNSEGLGIAKPTELTGLIQVINSKITALAPTLDSNDMAPYFQFHLDKVHSYRVSGFYDDAIYELDQSSTWTFNYEQMQRAGYWNCVCEAEQDYHLGELKEERFMYKLDECHLAFAGYNYKTNGRYQNSSLEKQIVFNFHPQPVVDELHLFASPAINERVQLSVIDLSGRLLENRTVNWVGNTNTLDLIHLKTGIYFIKIVSISFSKTLKIIKK